MKRALLIVCLLWASCSVTRRLPAGAYLMQEVTVRADKQAPRRERIKADELRKYIRQTPNKRLLGLNFYAWVWQHTDFDKDTWWERVKRRIGQEPVILDTLLTEQSVRNLKGYLDYRGFFSSEVTQKTDTTSRRRRAKTTYTVTQRAPYHIGQIDYEFRDTSLRQLILPDTARTLLHTGGVLDMERLDGERTRIAAYLRENGYYTFSPSNIEYTADTLAGDRRAALTLIVKQNLSGYDARGQAIMRSNALYRISPIYVHPAYDPQDPAYRQGLDTIYYQGLNVVYPRALGRPNIRPQVLRQVIPIQPNWEFHASQVDQTYNQMMSMGYFRSANVVFTEREQPGSMVSFVGEGEPLYQTQQRYLQCDIQGIPALRQSYKIDVEGSFTSSFYGLRGTIGYTNRNAFRGSEAFDIAFTAGYEYITSRAAKIRHATEFGLQSGLQFPRFVLPFPTQGWTSVRAERSRLSLGVNFQNRPNYRRTLSSASWGYSWSDLKYSSYTLRPIDINVVDVGWIDDAFFAKLSNPYLKESYRSQFVGGLSFGYVYNNQRRSLQGDATVVRFNFETAGNLISAASHAFWRRSAEGHYNIFGLRYAQYARLDLSLAHKVVLGPKTALVGRLYGGYGRAYGNSNAIPFDRQFYAGGANSMRGWSPRTLGAGGQGEDTESTYPAQTGDMKLEANLELRFPVWGMFHGALFADAGNIWFADKRTAPVPEAVFGRGSFRQLGFDAGIGVRLDVKFAIIRLDWGVQLHNPNRAAGDRWIRHFRWSRTALNFGVGYPF